VIVQARICCVLFVVLLFLLVLVHLSWWQHGEKILRMRAEQKEGTRPPRMRATP
jgi:hypothetical protein